MTTTFRGHKDTSSELPNERVEGTFRPLDSPYSMPRHLSLADNLQQYSTSPRYTNTDIAFISRSHNVGDFHTVNLDDSDNEDESHIVVIEPMRRDGPRSPPTPGHVQRIYCQPSEPSKDQDEILELTAAGPPLTNEVPEPNLINESPFVRFEYIRRSISLPDIDKIRSRVLMNHALNDDDETANNNISDQQHPQHYPNRMTRISHRIEVFSDGAFNAEPNHMLANPKLSQNWLGGVLGCFRPILGIFNQKGAKDAKDTWEIPYELLSDMKYIGCGAQGSVYLARLNNEQVAVKRMREACETEIHNLRKLNHVNIVAFKGVCTHPSNYCIVMEYCQYGQLCQYLKSIRDHPSEWMRPAQIIDWSRQIALGMDYLHKHNIIHRDLKSPNVLIGDNNVLKISDFGTSRHLIDGHSTKMSFAGTVAWMAPEVIRNEPCSGKVDIWSYGVVLWELLTLEIPYRDFEQSTIIYGVGQSTLKLPIPKTFPNSYMQLLEKCWKPKPKLRPHFHELLSYLDEAERDFNDIKVDDFYERQQIWKNEVRSCLSQARISFHSSNSQLEQSVESNRATNQSRSSAEHPSEPKESSSVLRQRQEEAARQQAELEKYQKIVKEMATMYQHMFSVIEGLDERERQLGDIEDNATTKRPPKRDQVSSLLKMAYPIYRSAIELSRQTSSPGAATGDESREIQRHSDATTVDDLNLLQYAKCIDASPIKSNFASSGSVKSRLRRQRRGRNVSANQQQHQRAPSNSIADSLYTDPSLDQDTSVSFNISMDQQMSHSIEGALDDAISAAQGGEVPMIRGVPQRRTFDSGYGDSQSCVSSPVAEQKNKHLGDSSQLTCGESFASQMSYSRESDRSRSRARLRRQKAVDRGSAPSSANSRSSRCNTASTIKHQVANSSTDYEDHEDDDDERDDLRSMNSLSLGRLPRGDSGCHVKAYNKLRRKTSFNISSSDDDDQMHDDDDDDECNTSSHSSDGSSSSVNQTDAIRPPSPIIHKQLRSVSRKLNRLAIPPPKHSVTKTERSDLSPQIVSS